MLPDTLATGTAKPPNSKLAQGLKLTAGHGKDRATGREGGG